MLRTATLNAACEPSGRLLKSRLKLSERSYLNLGHQDRPGRNRRHRRPPPDLRQYPQWPPSPSPATQRSRTKPPRRVSAREEAVQSRRRHAPPLEAEHLVCPSCVGAESLAEGRSS